MRIVQITYRYRLEPGSGQTAVLARSAGARRWVWNWALSRKRAYYTLTGKGLTYHALAAALTELKQQPATAWLRDIDSQLLQQALRDLETAFGNFFAKRARFPRFRSIKRDTPRFRIPQRVAIAGQTIRVPKIGLIPARIHRPLAGTPKSATFKREADGHWYVAIVAEQEVSAHTNRTPRTHVGVDLGLKSFAVLSTGETVDNPRVFRTQQRKLARAGRAMSRKQRGSANRAKARAQVARLHAKIRQQRSDFLHKLTSRLVKSFDLISIEDLSVRGLARTKLAKSVYDAAWGQFRTFLTYKADRVDGYVQVIGRFYPSSRRCGACGAANHALTLADRVWMCAQCGSTHDRDVNAAGNIDREGVRLFMHHVAAGHAETQNACRASVSPANAGKAR
ncbi:MAG: transposase [Roseiflexaceae bacterium]|nr:transposase [Roseiflexaceae bacterium]